MIEINLLPEDLKKSQSHLKKMEMPELSLQNIPVLKVAAAFVGALIAFHLILFFIGLYSKANLNSLSKRYNELLPKKKEADSLKSQVELINKKVSAIDELMVKRFSWAKKLNDLSDSITPGVWLVEVLYEERLGERPGQAISRGSNQKGKKEAFRPGIEKTTLKYLIISGYASSMGEQGAALIGKFIKSLKDNESFYAHFSNIELGSIRSDRVQDQEVMNFKITCSFKETDQ